MVAKQGTGDLTPSTKVGGLEGTIQAITPAVNEKLEASVQQRLDSLTKPRGSLGRLERVVIDYSLARGTADWTLPRKSLFVFCGDHGIVEEGVSAYPQDVTFQMVQNFISGGAAINVLCRQNDIDPVIVDMGVNHTFDDGRGIVNRKVAPGTKSFLREPAMTREQAVQSIEAGIALAGAAARLQYGLLAIGEMGIGNTTSASAITAVLANRPAVEVVGPGAGLTDKQLDHKTRVLVKALEARDVDGDDPVGVLAAVGGFEIGGMCGFLLGAAAARVPVAVDGFIATAAALLAVRLSPPVRDYLFLSHRSAEPGHRVALEALNREPLLSLEMRLGEGTGAAIAVGVIASALRLYREMATFESAAVSDRE